jgi:4'-phosphopantetheinyl transferase
VTSAGVDRLGPDELHVWTLRFADAAAGLDYLERELDESERARAARFATPELRLRWTIARGALRTILASYLGVAPRDVRIVARPCTACGGPHGKPALADPADALRFNLAHTRDLLVVAVARGREVGVDAEPVTSERSVASTAHVWLAPAEAATVDGVPPSAREQTLLRLWTLKEAYLKAVGTGLNTDLRTVVVSLTGNAARLEAAPEEPDPGRWLLLPLGTTDDTTASLAVARTVHESWTPEVVMRTFEASIGGS